MLPQPIQFQLSKKLSVFSDVFTASLKSTFNFEHLQENVQPHRLCISDIIDGKPSAYVNVKRVTIQYTLGQSTF